MANELSKREIDNLLGLRSHTEDEKPRMITLDEKNKRDLLALIILSKKLDLDLNNVTNISWDVIGGLLKDIDFNNNSLPSEEDFLMSSPNGNKYMTLEIYQEVLLQAKSEIEKNGSTDVSKILDQKGLNNISSAIVIK